MTFAEDLKSKIKDADVEKQLTALVDDATHLMEAAVGKAGTVAYDKRDDVEVWLDSAAGKVNERTDGKYAENLAKAQAAFLTGIDKIAEQRPSHKDTTTPSGPPSELRPGHDAQTDPTPE